MRLLARSRKHPTLYAAFIATAGTSISTVAGHASRCAAQAAAEVTREQRQQFEDILKPLVLALRAEFDVPTWTIYARALEDVPQVLLAAAVRRAAQSATFM